MNNNFIDIDNPTNNIDINTNIYKPLTIIGRVQNLNIDDKFTLAEGIPTQNSLLDITYPLIKTRISVASTNDEDHILKNGAKVILVEGLDGVRNEITELISLCGKDKVISEKIFFRINKMTVISVGNLKTNQGIIYCSNENEKYIDGIPTEYVYHTIGIGTNMSMVSIYSMPNAKYYKKAIGVRFLVSCDATLKDPIDLEIKQTNDGFPEITKAYIPATHFSSTFNLGEEYPANADIRVVGKMRGVLEKTILLYYSFILKKSS